jgi:hypothetical protein
MMKRMRNFRTVGSRNFVDSFRCNPALNCHKMHYHSYGKWFLAGSRSAFVARFAVMAVMATVHQMHQRARQQDEIR